MVFFRPWDIVLINTRLFVHLYDSLHYCDWKRQYFLQAIMFHVHMNHIWYSHFMLKNWSHLIISKLWRFLHFPWAFLFFSIIIKSLI